MKTSKKLLIAGAAAATAAAVGTAAFFFGTEDVDLKQSLAALNNRAQILGDIHRTLNDIPYRRTLSPIYTNEEWLI